VDYLKLFVGWVSDDREQMTEYSFKLCSASRCLIYCPQLSVLCHLIVASCEVFWETAMGIQVNFEGKIALITGASSGLGARFAKVLARAGAQVVLAARRLDRLKELRAEIESHGGAAHMVQLDVTDYGSIKAAIAHAETEAGPIDILINNAGVGTVQKLLDVTPDDYAFTMDTNQRGAFFVAQETAKRMVARAKGDPKLQHRIVNIASTAGLRVEPEMGTYCISKAAVVHMTKVMALEWGKYGINVNAICPGYILTELNQRYFDSDAGKKTLAGLPRTRVGRPEDLDGLLLLLTAEESRLINGAVVTADDGMSV
jgi:NAD(P)-dependent dehydrogenase (short-subunit alcohol dehydrogenase family)